MYIEGTFFIMQGYPQIKTEYMFKFPYSMHCTCLKKNHLYEKCGLRNVTMHSFKISNQIQSTEFNKYGNLTSTWYRYQYHPGISNNQPILIKN